MGRPKKAETTNDQELIAMRAQIELLTKMAANNGAARPQFVGKQVVGVRNISSYTMSLINRIAGEEGEISLHAAFEGKYDPASSAVISYAFWQTLRKDKLVDRGMLMRDDSIIGAEPNSPEDRPEDLAAGFAINAVEFPHAWITSRTEDQIREDIAKMTSEPSVRRIAAAVDEKIFAIGEERFLDDEQRAKKAISALPGIYRFAETEAREKTWEFSPNYANIENERKTVARFD